ncbi:thiol reductant ABC exporter subunit CydD [Arthrobacter sp. BB-1]|uniref:thiol reductant ABC exporter subunit CydD n=1 Tax=unclassified Arthrobacter TaxID=235627 RepID=UPI0010DC2C04|nr:MULTISPECIES: thiol reductant ABC exporter subunit CydD [unclassified Arthrobacter]TNB72894.1 thiol reductant ABC exporter subunit CydD [Arthrobacter sp. BB-1]VII95674.1 Efflux ABC transporter for glutathione/L-cysteine, essential for assembly of bd-type respiratory oxidases > CydD subunit / Efflux ABC transporter for glutathione/L-cysteine, essential for assembly of bd-type respiratory oxidases > CydC subunit [Arthrobacter sp. DR-2P]
MRSSFPPGPATRSAIYLLGLLAALKALSLVLMGQAVASVLTGLVAGDAGWAGQVPLGLAGVVLRSLTVWGQAVAARRAALGIKEELRTQLLERALRNGAREAGPADGGLAVLATRGLDALDNYYTQFLPALVNCAAIPLLLGARILFADWVSAVVIVLTVPLVPLFMVLIGRYTEDNVREAQASLARLSAHMLELAKGLPVLVGLGRATAQRKALEEISEEYRARTMGTLRTAFLSALALELIATISVAVVAVFIGVRLVHGDMPLEAGLLALILAPDCYLPLRELGTAHHASDDGRVALAETTAVTEAPEPRPLPAAKAGRPGAPLTVTGLAVSYSGRSGPAVGPLTFSAPQGRITALDGASGAGKSTVLGVLAGTIGDGAGTTVSGAVQGLDRAALAWVPQHPVMLAETVLEEVVLYLSGDIHGGRGQAGVQAAARACLARAAAGHLARQHPAELSPGELRRVALARALARIEAGATVLLLDEPTAHLDDASAMAVEDAIRRIRGRVTVILVAHNERTRNLADHVVPVGPGRTVTAASHQPAGHQPAALPADAAQAGRIAPAGPDAGETPYSPPTTDAGAAPAAAEGAGNRATARLLSALLAPVRGKFAAAAAVGTLAAVFAVALSGLSGWLIIRASEQPPILYLLTAIVGVRFFGIGRAVLRYWERLLLHDAVFAALTRLRGRLWESLSRRALALRRLLQGGNVLGTVIDDVDTVRDLLPRVVLPPLTALAVSALALATTGLLVPAALPAVLAAAAGSLFLAPAVALWADRKSASAEQVLRSGVLRRISAALDARAELHANNVAFPVLAGLRAQDRRATRASQRSAWADGLGHAITTASCCAAAFAAAWLAAPAVSDGRLEPATAAVLVLLLLALVEPYAAMTTAVRQFPALRTVMRRVAASGALDADAPGSGGGAADGLQEVPARRSGAPGVEIENLAAAWPGGLPVFTGLDAVAEPGRWLAVTGPSGSGKSTLLSVLLGFLPAAAGAARVTGRAAWCPQEAHLFDSTIRGNLLLGRPSSDDRTAGGGTGGAGGDNELRDVLASVGLSGLVERLPAGLDTRIGPGGAFLSGGERQRLAVARTLMTGAEVILLDEPTAHLDAESARTMLADLRTGLRDRTVVLVTHNPADVHPEDARLVLAGSGDAGGAGRNGAPAYAAVAEGAQPSTS